MQSPLKKNASKLNQRKPANRNLTNGAQPQAKTGLAFSEGDVTQLTSLID